MVIMHVLVQNIVMSVTDTTNPYKEVMENIKK